MVAPDLDVGGVQPNIRPIALDGTGAEGVHALVDLAAKRELTMRQIRNILRLASEGISARQIGRLLGAVRSTIQDNLKRAQVAGLAWPLPADLTDAVLEERLFAHNGAVRGVRRRAEPVWSELVCELKRPAVNLMVLWEEYRAGHPEEYSYSRFCDLFRKFEARLSPVMRQEHRAGDKVFVDYSGKKLGITDPATGEVRFAEIFVAVLGASSYILGRLRAQKFFSLAETNQAIAGMVARINDHIMRRLGGSRRHLFETIERPALAVLPDVDYEFAEWGFACVSLDYHVEVCWYLYSVPHNLIRAQVDSRILARLVIIH